MTPFAIDKPAILERLGGDEDIYLMMLEVFLQDIDNNCAAIEAAAASGDPVLLQREAHTLKSLFATVSDDAGSAEALVLERRAKEGRVDGAVDAAAHLVDRLRDVAVVLERELGR